MLEERPDLRFNDVKCDPFGLALAGTVAMDKRSGAGGLYRLNEGPVATRLLDGLTVDNGLGWSPDSGTLWFADSASPTIAGFEYDVSEGLLDSVKTSIPPQECVDDEGGIWLALWGGGAVHRYLPDGRLDTVVVIPAPNVTNCAFGGDGLDRLFITTARRGLSDDDLERYPHAGGLFVVQPGATGPAATLWRPLGAANVKAICTAPDDIRLVIVKVIVVMARCCGRAIHPIGAGPVRFCFL